MNDEEKVSLLKDIEEILKGIDTDECSDREGWWETSTGAEFGAERLRLIRERIAALNELTL